MEEIIVFDNENVVDILNGFTVLIDRFNKYHFKRFIKSMRTNIPLVLHNIVMIEAHSKYYAIHYVGSVKILDARTARKHLRNRKIINFVRVNKNYIVNLAYIDYIDKRGNIHMRHIDKTIRITDPFKDKLI